ncbi:CheR family methyltransferase [Caldalkalibacillus salinus]|uniref:CheR family methyltransferase n=1 Tax=Caldalkalibacillus salinus TaxID=2803787 RepID=UPI001921AEB5|nr:protein-glutamate O-methyltransferase CheR [Caldalkalibacillus salinus]
MEDRDFLQFIQQVKAKTRIDLSQYKEAQMKRRLTSLREKRGFSTFRAYFDAIMVDPALYAEFLDRMTINVSEFFRNKNRWDVLERKILPDLYKNSNNLKVWSAACSTGEEPYSLVMLLQKFNPISQVSVKATDIDANAIIKAQEGTYLERSLQHVPDYLKRQYFTKVEDGYKISSKIKERVQFSQHNLLADSFDKQYDLIVCRNVLIYFTDEAKDLLYRKFSEALKPGGILFVGSTEQIFYPQTYEFESIETFFYQKINKKEKRSYD